MGSLKSALIAGLAGALCALAILLMAIARVSPVIVVFLVVPAAVGLLLALLVWRQGTWRELTQRRAALILQSAGALLVSRSMSGIGFGVLRAAGTFTASDTPDSVGVAFEYALG